MRTLGVKPLRPEESILNLSGGNQQKVILARWLRRHPFVLVLDEPTQGVDVGTKPEIYSLLRGVALQGSTVIVCSTDSEEIVEVSNRAIVLSAGHIHAELSGASLTLDRLNHEIVAA
jgi:ribose transport system ATP-binding protein